MSDVHKFMKLKVANIGYKNLQYIPTMFSVYNTLVILNAFPHMMYLHLFLELFQKALSLLARINCTCSCLQIAL